MEFSAPHLMLEYLTVASGLLASTSAGLPEVTAHGPRFAPGVLAVALGCAEHQAIIYSGRRKVEGRHGVATIRVSRSARKPEPCGVWAGSVRRNVK